MNMSLLRRASVGAAAFGAVMGLAAQTASLPAPPVAKVVPHVTEVNGRKLEDQLFLAAG